MKKIILAFDSFKGCVSATEISQRLKERIEKDFNCFDVASFPIADGGEGTISAIERCRECEAISCYVHNPLMEVIKAKYIIINNDVAVIEMAEASGLPLIPSNKRNPLYTTSYGTGELIADAISKGCKNIILGLGGSATNDAAIGMMSALGVRFLDKDNREVTPCGKELIRIEHIDDSCLSEEIKECIFTLACDVNNPLYGENGASYVFAPQKGASDEDVKLLDNGLRHISEIIKREKGIDVSKIACAGAAGGMGGGIMAFLNAEIKSGSDIIIQATGMDEALNDATIVFTGEGKMDLQTLMGKALTGVLERAKAKGISIVALAGCVEDYEILNKAGFTSIFSIQPAPVSHDRAMQKEFALENIERCVVQILRLLIQNIF